MHVTKVLTKNCKFSSVVSTRSSERKAARWVINKYVYAAGNPMTNTHKKSMFNNLKVRYEDEAQLTIDICDLVHFSDTN